MNHSTNKGDLALACQGPGSRCFSVHPDSTRQATAATSDRRREWSAGPAFVGTPAGTAAGPTEHVIDAATSGSSGVRAPGPYCVAKPRHPTTSATTPADYEVVRQPSRLVFGEQIGGRAKLARLARVRDAKLPLVRCVMADGSHAPPINPSLTDMGFSQ